MPHGGGRSHHPIDPAGHRPDGVGGAAGGGQRHVGGDLLVAGKGRRAGEPEAPRLVRGDLGGIAQVGDVAAGPDHIAAIGVGLEPSDPAVGAAVIEDQAQRHVGRHPGGDGHARQTPAGVLRHALQQDVLVVGPGDPALQGLRVDDPHALAVEGGEVGLQGRAAIVAARRRAAYVQHPVQVDDDALLAREVGGEDHAAAIGARLPRPLDRQALGGAVHGQVAVMQIETDGRLLQAGLAHPAHIAHAVVLGRHVRQHRPGDLDHHVGLAADPGRVEPLA